MWTLVLHLWVAGTLSTANYAHTFEDVADCVQARTVIMHLANEGRSSKAIEFGRCSYTPAEVEEVEDEPTHNFLSEA